MASQQIALLGIGQMGAAAAVSFARAGLSVTLWARDRAKLDAVPAQLARLDAFLNEHFGAPTVACGEISYTDDFAVVRDHADFVLECIAEDLDQKANLLRELVVSEQRGAIIASCTSGLSISELARRSGLGPRFLGAHFWNPPHLMPLVEIVEHDRLDRSVKDATCHLLREMGKMVVVCRDVPGFIGNRLQHAMWREAISLVQRGICTAEDVDLVARYTFGLRLPAVGPCENADLVGTELTAQIQSYLLEDLDASRGTQAIVQEMLERGDLGMRSGRGFYDWSQRDPQATIARRDEQIVRGLRVLEAIESEARSE